ncbi:kinase-like domain-containing protein [Gigaspora rosea]|nr:kinase-like domain-containing protein [Gigaspora rosea]
MIQGWTSGNKDIDNYIKGFQLAATEYENVIEWIPFDKLDNFQKIGEGGFGSVYSAIWSSGKRIIGKIPKYTQQRTQSYVVALKTLPGPQKNFLDEFKNYMKSRLLEQPDIIEPKYRPINNQLEVYGLTKDAVTNEFLMVFQYVNRGSLNNFLASNFQNLSWKKKLELLLGISKDLAKIHDAGYIHCDIHSGNILINECINGNIISYISDLGLSRTTDELSLEDGIYGVLPYIAPEVLIKQPYTTAADIYSFGIIMSEISTGKLPYCDVKHNEDLAIKIYAGLRPEFAKGTPECYIQLANQCMDANPSNRPSASEICKKLEDWYLKIRAEAINEDAKNLKKAFASADVMIKTLSTKLQDYPQVRSKLVEFLNVSEPESMPVI